VHDVLDYQHREVKCDKQNCMQHKKG